MLGAQSEEQCGGYAEAGLEGPGAGRTPIGDELVALAVGEPDAELGRGVQLLVHPGRVSEEAFDNGPSVHSSRTLRLSDRRNRS